MEVKNGPNEAFKIDETVPNKTQLIEQSEKIQKNISKIHDW